MEWFLADHDLMNPTGLKQYESMNGSTGIYRAQDHRLIQFGRNLRKFVQRWLLSLQNIADFDSSWASTWAEWGRESTDTSCNTVHGKKFNSEGGQILEQELREAEESLSLEILKTWLGQALSCWACFEHVVKLEISGDSFHPA